MRLHKGRIDVFYDIVQSVNGGQSRVAGSCTSICAKSFEYSMERPKVRTDGVRGALCVCYLNHLAYRSSQKPSLFRAVINFGSMPSFGGDKIKSQNVLPPRVGRQKAPLRSHRKRNWLLLLSFAVDFTGTGSKHHILDSLSSPCMPEIRSSLA